MSGFIARRLIQTIFVLFLVTIIVFLLMRLLPGDPVLLFLSQDQLGNFSPEQIQEVRHQLGLDQSYFLQYVNWIGGILHGDWGESWAYHFQVWDELSRRIPITAYLGGISFVLSALIGIPLGIIAAVRRGKWADVVATLIANLGITVPVFWLGILGIFFFGLYLNWLPTYGFTSPFEDFAFSTKQIIMPVFCLAIFTVASIARQTRSSLLEVIHQDYIRTAWSKGLSERSVIFKHALKNSLIPVITLMGISLRNIIGGAVLTETVFSIPGMGRLAVDAMVAKDYSTVQGVILITAVVVCLANLLVDIAYSWLDPRIRYG
jgi:peptide/nickel transport system permease protein